jgi:diacylglycerol kinase (ATP)
MWNHAAGSVLQITRQLSRILTSETGQEAGFVQNQNITGLKRLLAASSNSWKGFVAAWRYEEAFRQELLLVIVASPLAFVLGNSWIERALLLGSVLQILIVELLNTGIEVVVDRIGPDHHELSGRAKDVASAAVLLSLLLAASTWAMILLPRWL